MRLPRRRESDRHFENRSKPHQPCFPVFSPATHGRRLDGKRAIKKVSEELKSFLEQAHATNPDPVSPEPFVSQLHPDPVSPDLLLNARRDVTFVTWVYAEHKQTKAKQFLKWVRWKVNWDVDFSHGNTHPPGVTKKKYQFIKIDEGDGVGPVQTPSFNKATWEWKWTPKNTL